MAVQSGLIQKHFEFLGIKVIFAQNSGSLKEKPVGNTCNFNTNVNQVVTYGYSAEPQFIEVAGDRPYLFVKWRVRYIKPRYNEFEGNDQNVRYAC